MTPLVSLSTISKFVFVVSPQVPDCSPEPIFSIPPLVVYVDTMPHSYSISVHVCDAPVAIFDHDWGVPADIFEYVCDAPVAIFDHVCDAPVAMLE